MPKSNKVAPVGSKGDSDQGNRPTSAAGAKKGKKGKKGKKKDLDAADIGMEEQHHIRVPESVLPLSLPPPMQARLCCVEGQDVTPSRPFAFVKKLDLAAAGRSYDEMHYEDDFAALVRAVSSLLRSDVPAVSLAAAEMLLALVAAAG